MMINKLPVSEIKLNPNNPRLIKDDKFKKLVQSIKDFPEMANIRPVVLNKDHIILGGNMRYRAMKEAGWKEIPVAIVDLPEDKQREFVIKDNVSGGEWDWDLLANEWDIEQLDEWGLDLPDSMQDQSEVEEDEPPEVSSEPPVSKLGEIYQLGRHRVMCGDSTDKSQVEKLMNGVKADMVFTDPPYNIDYSDMTGKFEKIKNDKMTDDDFRQFLIDALLTEADTYYVCCSWQYSQIFREALEQLGKPVKAFIVWNKVNPAQNLDKYYKAHEIILYSGKFGGEKTRRSDVWELKRQKNTDHPTMKPIELIAMAIDDTPTAKMIYDGFLGSGSTLIACEQTDRTCYGMELDPKYVDVIRKRWAKFVYPDTWEERWEELTPIISGGTAEDGS
jgi:DNA modification methylase